MEKIATVVKQHPLARFAISYFARAVVLVLALYVIACTLPLMPPFVMAVVLAVLCTVSMVSVAYHAVAHKVLKNMQYRAGGRMNGLNEGRKLCLAMSLFYDHFVLGLAGMENNAMGSCYSIGNCFLFCVSRS